MFNLFFKKPLKIPNIISDLRGYTGKILLNKKDDDVDYFEDILERLPVPALHMEDVKDATGFRWCLRHDVDHDLDISLYMAKAEMDRGYKSTYFLLTPGSYPWVRNYYGWIDGKKVVHDPDLVDKCKYILDCGHRIGLHNDLVSLSLSLKVPPTELLEAELEFFSKHQIPISGTAAHGNPLARKLQYNNRELFEGCIRKGRDYGRTITYRGFSVKLHSVRLEDYDLAYEAYSLPRHSRVSESGRKWGGLCNGVQIDRTALNNSPNVGINLARYIDLIAGAEGEHSFQFMTHPDHWRAKLDNGNVIRGHINKYV